MLFRNQLSSLGNLESSFIHCSQSELSFFTLTRWLKFHYIPKIIAPLWHFFVYELQIPQLTHPKIFFQNGWLSIVIVFLLVFFFPLNYMWILNLYLKLFVPFLWFLYLKLFHLSFFFFFFLNHITIISLHFPSHRSIARPSPLHLLLFWL